MKPLVDLALSLALAFGCSSLLHAADNERLVPMFNGGDLAGWTNVNCAPETWTVRDGMIISTGIPTGVLRTTRMYENFIVELEWRHMVAGGNAGFFVYSAPITAVGQPFTKGMEIQIIDRDHAQGWATRHGDVFSIHGATFVPDKPHPQGWQRSLPSEKRVKPQGEWNHYRVESRDGVLTVAVNGKVVSGGSNCVPRKGYICLESEGSECHFRNVRIQELPSSNPPAGQVAEEDQGWMSLYNGLDLRGWKQEPGHAAHWKAKDWTLDYDGKSETPDKTLWSERTFRDFELIVDWRMPASPTKETPQAISNLSLRKTVVIPLVSAEAKPRGQWNRMRVTMRGEQVVARMNDKVILEKMLPGTPMEGMVGLQHSGAPIQFANIYVRELK